jgi:cell wall-associated NlpC family hydrolase
MSRLTPVTLVLSAIVALASVSACASGGGFAQPAAFPSLERPSHAKSTAASTASVDTVVQMALSLRGTRYRLGGQDPRRGLDCSGLVQYVFGQSQVSLPRTVDEQFGSGQVIDFDRIQAGDLLFFSTTKDGLEVGAATHVGIAVGPPSLGEFVHAPGSGSSVRVDRFDAPYWRARWVGARRVLIAPPVSR